MNREKKGAVAYEAPTIQELYIAVENGIAVSPTGNMQNMIPGMEDFEM